MVSNTGSTSIRHPATIATQLQLNGKEVSYIMSTLGNSSEVSSKTVSFNVTSVDASQKLNMCW